jgi:energy-coupling factor transporter ATP-binding protein EcfA2
VLAITGIEKAADRRAGKFSLGMSQRLGIAAALLGDPGVLLLDEPVNGLDPEGIRWIRNLMKNFAAQGPTVLVSSHLISEMAHTADALIVIGQSRPRRLRFPDRRPDGVAETPHDPLHLLHHGHLRGQHDHPGHGCAEP